MNFDVVIFISGTWPGYHKGYEIANLSTLDYFSKKAKQCLYFGPADEEIADVISNRYSNCSFHPVNFYRNPKGVRFIKTLFSDFPAITERFQGESKGIISGIEKEKKVQNEKILFFYEDIPSAFLLFKLKKQYKDSKHYVRSHNVVHKGFLGMSHQKNPLMNLLWKYELARIQKFEKSIFSMSDAFFSISEDDSNYYREKMNIHPSGCIGFFLDDMYFKKNSPSEENNLLFLGTADLRKSKALKKFIKIAWPVIRKNHPEVKLLIGGRYTESFNNPSSNIYAYGFIDNEQSFLDKGSIFINPQTEGAGIKIKSVVALAQSKPLVTTSIGAEGTGIRNQIHCIIEDDFKDQASVICSLLQNKPLQKELAEKGHEYVQARFSKKTFFNHMDNLIKPKNHVH